MILNQTQSMIYVSIMQGVLLFVTKLEPNLGVKCKSIDMRLCHVYIFSYDRMLQGCTDV